MKCFLFCYDEVKNIIWLFYRNEILIIDIKNQETYFRKGNGYNLDYKFSSIWYDKKTKSDINLISEQTYLILDLNILYKKLYIDQIISKTKNKIIKFEKEESINIMDVIIEMTHKREIINSIHLNRIF